MTKTKIYWLKHPIRGRVDSQSKVIVIIYFFLLRFNLISSNTELKLITKLSRNYYELYSTRAGVRTYRRMFSPVLFALVKTVDVKD